MKYFSRMWAKEYDGILFFVQRLEEMLYHYSNDIVRAPVHNTHTLIREYLSTRKEVNANKVMQYQLEQIAGELKESLRNDQILAYHFGNEMIVEFLQCAPHKWNDAVLYLNNKIDVKDYVNWCCEYLLNQASHPTHKEEIDAGLRAWIASIIWFGYTPEYVYEYLHTHFAKVNNSPLELLRTFLASFDFETHKYRVYLVFKEESIPYKQQLQDRLGITFIDEKSFGLLHVKKDRQYIGFVETESLDYQGAMDNAVNRIDIFVRYYQVLSNRRKSFFTRCGLVMNVDTEEQWICQRGYVEIKSIEIPKGIDVGSQIDFVIMGRTDKSETSNAKIEKIVALHNTAINQKDIKDAFINLWSILEVVAVKDSAENKIEAILDRAIPVLQQEYIVAMFEDIADALKDNLPPSTHAELYGRVVECEEMISKTMALVWLSSYEPILDDLFSKALAGYPIIREKIYKLHQLRNDAKSFASLIRKYGSRVRWHIYRLYRARNAIVHSGDTPKSLRALGEHLHIYVDVLIQCILYKLSMEDTLFSIQDALTDTNYILNHKLKLCDQGKPLNDISTIGELTAVFFWPIDHDPE